jgi:thiol:disulfide interchange protein DsbD
MMRMNRFTWILARVRQAVQRCVKTLAWVWLALLAALGLAGVSTSWAQTFLPVDQAFQVQVDVVQGRQLAAHFTLAPGVYLYRERFEASLSGDAGGAAQTLSWQFPKGDAKYDPTFEKTMEVYHHDVEGRLDLPAGLPAGPHVLTVSYQGCADAGLCYPPQHHRVTLTLGPQGEVQALADAPDASGAPNASGTAGSGGAASPLAGLLEGLGGGARSVAGTPAGATPSGDASVSTAAGDDRIGQALASGQWLTIVPVFLLAGVLLSLTPCVLPMVPILSSIIVGQRERVGRARGFGLALSYSQGMALVYTALGVAAGLLGQGLAAYLQHPWVLLGFAAVMVLLSLSMFGLYELQLPAALQGWLGEGSQRLPGGRFVSVFAMGAVSALIVSPCVSAPLAGALLYISQTHNVLLGGSALYAMAWGMSVPLLLVGLSAGSVLPRTGPWMKAIKALFGVLMLAMAAWIARPAWPALQSLVGLQPAVTTHTSVLPFERVRSAAELDAAVARAASQGRPVMLDFYADWCTSCLEMERFTFTDPAVRARLAGAVLLQADVTLNNADDRALLARFGLFGPPGLIFYDAQGREQAEARVVGYQDPAKFLASLARAGLR